jgi:hypothetical protein
MAVTLSGSGQVPVQVISAIKTDVFSSTSTSFTNITGMSVSITPTSASNRVLVRLDTSLSGSSLMVTRITRNGTAIAIGDAAGSRNRATNLAIQYAGVNGDRGGYGGISFLDSPATTSAVTYQLQAFTDSGTFYLNRTPSDGDSSSFGARAVSTITVMEISG